MITTNVCGWFDCNNTTKLCDHCIAKVISDVQKTEKTNKPWEDRKDEQHCCTGF